MRKQHIAIPCRYCEPALAIQIELRCSLKHPIPHLYPLFTTYNHYIEKTQGGQARKLDFSLRDNELAHLVNAKKICLKSNGLHRQAKVVCYGES